MCAGFVIINASPFLSFVLIKLQCYDDFNNQAVIFGSIFVLIFDLRINNNLLDPSNLPQSACRQTYLVQTIIQCS